MNDPAVAALSNLQSVLKSLDTSLSHLATVARAKVLYANDEFQALAHQYRELYAADQVAHRALQAVLPKNGMSYEARVKAHGEDEARRQFAPFAKALETKIETGRAVATFECEHALVARLVCGSTRELKM